MGFTDTELETLSNQADQDIIEGRFTPTRQTNLPSLCKAVLLVMAQQRKKWVCAAELMEPLNEKGAELKTRLRQIKGFFYLYSIIPRPVLGAFG